MNDMRDEWVAKMREIASGDDTEAAHSMADNLLCCVLSHLGYNDVVQEFLKVGKWYA